MISIKAKEFLKSIERYDNLASMKKATAERIQEDTTELTSEEIEETRKKILDDINLYYELVDAATELVSLIEKDRYRQILYKLYFEYQTFKEIAADLFLEEQTIRKQHGHALQAFEHIYKINQDKLSGLISRLTTK